MAIKTYFNYLIVVLVSNPPPSPVTDGNRENSSDFDTHNIQHVNVTSPEKAGSSKEANFNAIANLRQAAESAQNEQQRAQQMHSNEDDFLDMHCDDMDMF